MPTLLTAKTRLMSAKAESIKSFFALIKMNQ